MIKMRKKYLDRSYLAGVLAETGDPTCDHHGHKMPWRTELRTWLMSSLTGEKSGMY